MVSTIIITFEKTQNGTQLIGKCTCLVDRILKPTKLYKIVYSSSPGKKLGFPRSQSLQGQDLALPASPSIFHSSMRHHHRHHHQYMLSYKWFSQDPSANTLMPSVPEDLNGAFWTPFSDLKSPHPRFGPLLLLMMVNRATIQIHFTEAPVPWAEQQGHISGLSLVVGEWTSSRERELNG